MTSRSHDGIPHRVTAKKPVSSTWSGRRSGREESVGSLGNQATMQEVGGQDLGFALAWSVSGGTRAER